MFTVLRLHRLHLESNETKENQNIVDNRRKDLFVEKKMLRWVSRTFKKNKY